jgi:excisionase family DNA binding protein
MEQGGKETMSTQEVCEILGISRATLQRRVETGEIAPLPKKPGQKRNFPRRYSSEIIRKMAAEESTTQVN